jgi:hypothetical protein
MADRVSAGPRVITEAAERAACFEDDPPKQARATVNNQSTKKQQQSPPSSQHLYPPCEDISSSTLQFHSPEQVLPNSAISHRRRSFLLPPSHCCASFHCPARLLRSDTNTRATRQPILCSAKHTLTRRVDSRLVFEKHCESGAPPQTPLVSRANIRNRICQKLLTNLSRCHPPPTRINSSQWPTWTLTPHAATRSRVL